MTKSVFTAGGDVSNSTDFHLVSAFGQPILLGESSSGDFVLQSGFLTLEFEQLR